jgi:hypothetical protein
MMPAAIKGVPHSLRQMNVIPPIMSRAQCPRSVSGIKADQQ